MSDVKLIECPRDAWQGLQGQIPAETKLAYLRALVAAGFKHIDAASFVSPKAVPQMADSEEVLEQLDPPDDVEIIGIVVNQRGADRAIATEAVGTLGFPYSISPTFLQHNQKQTLEEAMAELEQIRIKADDVGMGVVAYVSMAFGNPYGDLWSIRELTEAVGLLADLDIREISLADTVGAADAAKIAEVVGTVTSLYQGPRLEIGVHLHSRPESVDQKILAAYDAGCRRFDSAVGGLGGCPFAQDLLVGNIATETLISALARRHVALPALRPLDQLISMSGVIGSKYVNPGLSTM